MDLKNNKILMGEVLQSPQAKEILKSEFPELMSPFMLRMARKKSIEEVLKIAKGRIPQDRIDRAIEKLKAI